MKLVLLFCTSLLVLAPLASADPQGQDHQGQGSQGDQGGHGSHGQDDQGQGGSGSSGNESVQLRGHMDQNTARLQWTFQGATGNVKSFAVYRAVNGGASQLVATLDSGARSFDDAGLQQNGMYSYSVSAQHSNSASSTQSNTQHLLLACTFLSIDPGGNPPILFNPECLPLTP